LVDVSHALSIATSEGYDQGPAIDNLNYKRMIVKSPCFTVKMCEKPESGKRLFACGTQLGQVYIGNVDEEATTNQEKLYYYQSRYYNTTLLLQKERENP
jgi:hypothetical protein